MALTAARAVFIDKDGTLVENLPYNVDMKRVRFTPHALEACRLLASYGYALVVATNQPGVALGKFPRETLRRLSVAFTARLADEGIPLFDFRACPHHPEGTVWPWALSCVCRKPAPGLLQQAARVHDIALEQSWMVGDILDDVEAGRRAGCRTVLLDVGNETEWKWTARRAPHYRARDLLEAAQRIVAADYGSLAREP
jgi:D-glycero-D-manno-heptose 1,7-bisphosphate phosphatase